MDHEQVKVTKEVQGANHTEDEAQRTQATINEIKAAVEARKAAKAAKEEKKD